MSRMYALDENYRFPIYWTNNPSLSVSSFDYDKLNALEIRALAVLDAFQVVKVKELLHMADEPKQISKVLGNVYKCILLFFGDLIILSF